MNELSVVFATFAQGFFIMTLAAVLGGAWVCAAYRRLSPMLIVASCGFIGIFVAAMIVVLTSIGSPWFHEFGLIAFFLASIIGLFSTIALIFGLGASLADIRRQLALSMERPHGTP